MWRDCGGMIGLPQHAKAGPTGIMLKCWVEKEEPVRAMQDVEKSRRHGRFATACAITALIEEQPLQKVAGSWGAAGGIVKDGELPLGPLSLVCCFHVKRDTLNFDRSRLWVVAGLPQHDQVGWMHVLAAAAASTLLWQMRLMPTERGARCLHISGAAAKGARTPLIAALD